MGLHGVGTLGFCPFSARGASWPATGPAGPGSSNTGLANKPGCAELGARLTAGYHRQGLSRRLNVRARPPQPCQLGCSPGVFGNREVDVTANIPLRAPPPGALPQEPGG